MKNPNPVSFNPVSHLAVPVGLVVCLLTLPFGVKAIEDPPGCSLPNGGNGASYQSGINFALTQAHVGDSVPVFPIFGMAHGACRAVNVTGSVYIATGKLTNFLDNATLDPGFMVVRPCDLIITPALVGAGVSSPHGSIAGVPMVVRAIENVDGTALTGVVQERFGDFHTASISIVSPALQVVQQPAYPSGQTSFRAGGNAQYTGYVTNSGDITLTNVTVIDDRAGQIELINPADGQAFSANVILPPGAYAVFSASFTPTPEETGAGSAANRITATAQDTTAIGGPRAIVTETMTNSCAIGEVGGVAAILSEPEYTAEHQFRFNVTGLSGMNYAVQAITNLTSTNWISIGTNTAPFTFVDTNAGQFPTRFYRAMALP